MSDQLYEELKINKPNAPVSLLKKAILEVICYYDVFDHPVTLIEIERNLSFPMKNFSLIQELNELKTKNIIKNVDGYFFLNSRDANITRTRLEKEELARKISGKAYFFGRIIGSFPFVHGVCISGSLSKGVLEKNGDVDFFVITSSQRLWVCRSFLILFKKLILFNSRKYFCVNYFVDKDDLFIPDHNIFTATEISSLLPVINYDAYRGFLNKNRWIKQFRLNLIPHDRNKCKPYNKNAIKKSIEFVLNGKLGEKVDNWFFKLTLKRWKKKFPDFNLEEFDLNLRSRKTVSKHHPRGYQQKVLLAYDERMTGALNLLKKNNS